MLNPSIHKGLVLILARIMTKPSYKFSGIVDEIAIFNKAINEDDIPNIMNDGLGKALGIAAVDSSGKMTATWGKIKSAL